MTKIIIDSIDRDMVQKADIEMSSKMNLISFIISRNMDIDTERFRQYEKEYQEAFFAFEAAKEAIVKKYLNNVNANWTLDYATATLSYEE